MADRIAAIVEGHTEHAFVRSSIPNAIVHRILPNGKDVSVELIAKTIVDHVETLDGSIKHIIVLLDRERRGATAEIFRDLLEESISKLGCGRSIAIGVSDLMIENWILADETFIRETFKFPAYSYAGDGTHGKRGLQKLNKGSDAPFNEKARWLKCVAVSRAAIKSKSLSDFSGRLAFDWAWATK